MRMIRFVMVAAVLALTGCASMRGVDVGSGDNATFAVDVTNYRAGTVSVSYSGNGVSGDLGTVAPRMTERFIIAVNQPQQITIVARTTSGASAGNYPVTLEAGVTKRVTVR